MLSRKLGRDLPRLVLGERPQRLGRHVAPDAGRQGQLGDGLVVGGLAHHDRVIPTHGEVEGQQFGPLRLSVPSGVVNARREVLEGLQADGFARRPRNPGLRPRA